MRNDWIKVGACGNPVPCLSQMQKCKIAAADEVSHPAIAQGKTIAQNMAFSLFGASLG